MDDEKTLVQSVLESFPEEGPREDRLDYFADEIEMITDPKIKSFVRSIMKMAEPFWVSPASMVEGMHPPDEYGPEGMILHTKRVFRTAALLMATIDMSSEEADCVFAAALLHDITKATWADEEETIVIHDSMHPYTVDMIVQMCRRYDEMNNVHPPEDNSLEIDDASMKIILRLIRHSHGIFSPIPETIPQNNVENLLATADLLASNLHVLVDGPDVVIDRWI